MEIYISEKEAKENDVVVARNNYLQDSRIQSNSKNVEFILKSLEKHEAEVRNKVIDELLEWANSKMMDWINTPKYREPHFRGTRIIHYYELQQKLAELKGE